MCAYLPVFHKHLQVLQYLLFGAPTKIQDVLLFSLPTFHIKMSG